MIDHTGLKVSDPVESRRFYEAALAALGYRVLMEIPTEHTGGPERPEHPCRATPRS